MHPYQRHRVFSRNRFAPSLFQKQKYPIHSRFQLLVRGGFLLLYLARRQKRKLKRIKYQDEFDCF